MSREELRKAEIRELKYEQVGVAMTCRSYTEYEQMFQLRQTMKGKVLDVAAGASSFTAEALKRGIDAYAVDPQYEKSVNVLQEEGSNELLLARKKLLHAYELFNWETYGSIDKLMKLRERSLTMFLNNYVECKERYINGQLTLLPFANNQFSLIVCSHFLFLYGKKFTFDFHERSLRELIRICEVGGEIRLYPLLGFDGDLYPHVDELKQRLSELPVTIKQAKVDFQFVKGATHMLVLTK
ncbi:class I SAM-dependent methyltransferase [Halalkalibacter sp. APA_J-10(15)]|uniref:class I SAM-dependent methyltransferase n=1 Tax=Halalkalibacter sp. APA_J-10(15) TaxID=2933805 RepID=UPI001FF381E2|nr:class I SAM-dependent methyltransferase [Halalkalibacter sp. APA_J-10(15)]MCK0470949.1 class I SAM-dependent methyltransferase [Halalkalibacter sp. APA_J-10(15)]